MNRERLVIVGGGLAAAKAAEGARQAGFGGSVVIVGDERHPPYERPPLSKAVLRGEADFDAAAVHPRDFYDEHDVELVSDTVVSIDTVGRRVELLGEPDLPFDRAVVATGAEPRRLAVPGADLAGVHYLRTFDDAVALRDAVGVGARVAVVGAGWVGSEVAASVRQRGVETVLIDPAPAPLGRVLGSQMGEVFRRLHADHGVELRLGMGVAALRGVMAVEEVVLSDGRVEPADVVVVGVGVIPRTALAEAAAGIRVNDGIVVDERLETTVPGIFAAGDVASAWHPRYGRHVRVEHWANALNQGQTAGRNAAGGRDVYDRVPYFFSDQYDLGMEYVGYGAPDDDVVVRGDLDGREFTAFWLRDGLVTAAMAVNVWDVIDDLKAVVASGHGVPSDAVPARGAA